MGVRRCSHGHLYMDDKTDCCPECGEPSDAPGNRRIREDSTASSGSETAQYPRNHEKEENPPRMVYAGPPLLDPEDGWWKRFLKKWRR